MLLDDPTDDMDEEFLNALELLITTPTSFSMQTCLKYPRQRIPKVQQP